MALTTEDLANAAPAAPQTPAAPAAPEAAAPAASPDFALKAALGVTGGDQAAAQKAVQSVGTSPKPGVVIPPLEPKDPNAANVPDAVLQIPAFRAILNGQPPAVSAKDQDQDPAIKIITENVQPLLYSGFGFYRNLANTATYLYNGRFMDGDVLKVADQKGKLDEIVPPFAELKSAFDSGLAEGGAEAAPAGAAPVAPTVGATSQPAVPPAPASAQKNLTNARLKNIAVGAPSSGPVPGSGRILNSILKTSV